MLTILVTSPRVAPGLLSWPAWQALRSAGLVLAPPGHPQLPALDEAGITYRVVESDGELLATDEVVVWLPEPGAELVIPPGARFLHGSADLPGAERSGVTATPAVPSALDGVPFGQPALALAAQLQRRAARAGVPDELVRPDGE